MRRQDEQSRVFYELSALILNILRSPSSTLSLSDQSPVTPPPAAMSSRRPLPATLPQITPAGFASLLLGISVALMLCGSVTFFIGFLLMPWVLGLIMVFYVVAIVSGLSMLGRAILCHSTSPSPSSPRKEVPGKGSPSRNSIFMLSFFIFYFAIIEGELCMLYLFIYIQDDD